MFAFSIFLYTENWNRHSLWPSLFLLTVIFSLKSKRAHYSQRDLQETPAVVKVYKPNTVCWCIQATALAYVLVNLVTLSSRFTPCYFLIAEIEFLLKIRKGHWDDLILACIWRFTITFQEVFFEDVRALNHSLQLLLVSTGVILRNYDLVYNA